MGDTSPGPGDIRPRLGSGHKPSGQGEPQAAPGPPPPTGSSSPRPVVQRSLLAGTCGVGSKGTIQKWETARRTVAEMGTEEHRERKEEAVRTARKHEGSHRTWAGQQAAKRSSRSLTRESPEPRPRGQAPHRPRVGLSSLPHQPHSWLCRHSWHVRKPAQLLHRGSECTLRREELRVRAGRPWGSPAHGPLGSPAHHPRTAPPTDP